MKLKLQSKFKIDINKILVDEDSLVTNKEYNKVSKIHKYWSRKPWYIVKDYLGKYSELNDTVLDPFCGSGIIGLESILQKRNFIGYDLNPFAVFLSNQTLNIDFNEFEFNKEIKKLVDSLKDEVMNLYKVEKDLYTLYNIIGAGNKKEYNSVLCNYDFKNKSKKKIDLTQNKKYVIKQKFPDRDFPTKFHKDRFSYKGITKVSEMFTKRNLKALSLVYNYVSNNKTPYKPLLQLALTNTLLHVSKLKGENVRPLGVNNYWIPDDFIEENVIWRFLDRISNIIEAKKIIQKRYSNNKSKDSGNFIIYNKSSLQLDDLADSSVDYIMTDPPYGEAIQYSELSFIWNTWMEEEYEIEKEVIINPVQKKGILEFHDAINEFITNAHRVLKPSKYFTLCFHNKEVKIWTEIIKMIRNVGFDLEDIKIYNVFGSPYNKHWSKFSPKSDLYVTFKRSERNFGNCFIDLDNINPYLLARKIKSDLSNNGTYDLNKAYDLFVAEVIVKIFDGHGTDELLKLDIKKIITLFNV